MNSMSRGYYEPCGREKRREEENKCPTIIKCGCPSSAQILTTAAAPTATGTIASVTVDNTCLCDPITKLEFATIISTATDGFAGTVTLRVFKQCRHQFTPAPIGPAWTVTLTAGATLPLSFFICDSDSCEDDCCTYTVVATATATASGIVTFNNATLGAISTCKSNKCKENCRE